MTAKSLVDSYGRVMRDLRISVTDRCNFRCLYCLPETEEAANFYRTRSDSRKNPNPAEPIELELKPKSQILSLEEIERMARIFIGLGIDKIRLTGGEPLLRRGLEDLIGNLSGIPGLKDLAMTTNGFSFSKRVKALKDAGLRRVSFSLDSLDRENFKKLTGRDGLNEALEGIEMARSSGMNPVKINAVVIRGLNDHEIEALAEFARDRDVSMRFIEFMPLDSKRAWQKEHSSTPGK